MVCSRGSTHSADCIVEFADRTRPGLRSTRHEGWAGAGVPARSSQRHSPSTVQRAALRLFEARVRLPPCNP